MSEIHDLKTRLTEHKKKSKGIPRKDTYTQADLDAEIDRLRSNFESQIANLELQYKQQIHDLEFGLTNTNGALRDQMTKTEETERNLQSIIERVVNERDLQSDQIGVMECIIKALNDKCMELSAEARRANGEILKGNEEIARLAAELSKEMGRRECPVH